MKAVWFLKLSLKEIDFFYSVEKSAEETFSKKFYPRKRDRTSITNEWSSCEPVDVPVLSMFTYTKMTFVIT